MPNEDEFREIPGWGVDRKEADRPGVPHENFHARVRTGGLPGAQPRSVEILKGVDVPRMTPVFGTSVPPRLVSGMMKRAAYGMREFRWSRWMLLVASDRVDVLEHRLERLVTRRPLLKAGVLGAGLVAVLALRSRRARLA